MLSTKFDAQDITKVLRDMVALTDTEKSAMLAQFATVEIAAADQANASAMGRKVPYQTYVDGRANSNLMSVRPDGVIVAEWELGVELVRWVYTTLREKAPVLKGEYRDSITIFAGDQAVSSPDDIGDADMITIMSTVPYARKLEGVSDGKYMSAKNKPDGSIFEFVSQMAKSRFSNQAKIIFTYRNLGGMTSSLEAWATIRRIKNSRKFGSRAAKRQYDKDTRNPAILIMLK